MQINTRTYSLPIERHPDGYLAYFPALEGCNALGKSTEALALYLVCYFLFVTAFARIGLADKKVAGMVDLLV
jgi:hypothetical protein